eukprot:TRINITY_DN740_c0_g1_i2.p1 TRINITY_DN740_c0_g1~~TRINITY_DN740_c0_g1_i2.p1  ORF type:complete len:217 (+),score=51.21 TRINITY_DN740_c0_g1_i2:273-923(+)
MALKNSYWVLRHGRSIPNEKGLIVSSLENGILPENGLATAGIAQANAAGELFSKEISTEGVSIENIQIFVSPFSRTQQTAEAVARSLNIPMDSHQIKVTEELRERYFGPQLELQSHEHYPEIWELDERDPFCPPDGGESVANVASRLSKFVLQTEAEYKGFTILVIAHGDPLQILQTILDQFQHGDLNDINEIFTVPILSKHRKFSLLTGELRRAI